MKAIVIKIFIILLLSGVLSFLIFYAKGDESGHKGDRVTLVEKYYSPSHSSYAVGVKTKREIKVENSTEKSCALEFSNEKIFEVDCEKYLDFQIGDKAVIHYEKNTLIKLSRK